MSTFSAKAPDVSLPLDITESSVPRFPLYSGTIRKYQEAEGRDETPYKRQRLQSDPVLRPPCSEINFDEIFRKADAHFATYYVNGRVPPSGRNRSSSSSDGLFVLDIGVRPEQAGHCPLCAFFAAVKGPDTKGPFQLRAFSSVTCSSFLNIDMEPTHAIGMVQNAFLVVAPMHTIKFALAALPSSWHPIYRALPQDAAPKPLGIWAKELKTSVDYNEVNEWLSFCKKHHRGACVLSKHQAVKALPGFRLIDCDSDSSSMNILEKPLTERYAALSYVWGEEITVCGSTWPKVVLDAILVTRQLGLQYLWVDRFCIDRDNAQEKHFLISKMAAIYQNAEFTIIAAAGSGASHGLPGVGLTKRRPQPKIRMGETVLASILENRRQDIYQSTWRTRGWTYQEGVLARRRIVFTEGQVYWECASMVTWEAVHLPLELLHTKNKLRMSSCVAVGLFGGKPPGWYNHQSKGLGEKKTLLQVAEHIQNFSRRNLKFSTDSLLAMQGILRNYSDSNPRLTFLHGLPILSGKIPGVQGPGHARLASFAVALTSWAHTDNSCQAQRLPHLPSWTWAGWKGEITWSIIKGIRSFSYEEAINALFSVDPDWAWTADIHLRLRNDKAQSLLKIPQETLLDSDFDGMLRISQPYALHYHDLLAEGEKQPWRTELTGHDEPLLLCLSICEVVVVSERDFLRTITGDLVLVLIALVEDENWTFWKGVIARFLVIRPIPLPVTAGGLEQSSHWERIGVAWIHVRQPGGPELTTEDVIQRLGVKHMSDDVVIC